MKKIFYVDNNNNFWLYLKLAVLREDQNWFFLIFDKSKEKYLVDRGINYSLFELSFRSTSDIDSSHEGKTKYNLAIKNDRILRRLPKKISWFILRQQEVFFSNAVDCFKPDIILGEVSWGNEYIFSEHAKKKGVPYYHLLNLPLGENHVVAFDQKHSYESISKQIIVDKKDSYKISYMELCAGVRDKRKNILGSIKRFIDIKSQFNDYRLNQLYWKGRLVIKQLYRSFDFLLSCNNLSLDEAVIRSKGKKVIYFSLHVQPESTPDFVSPNLNDQLKILLRIVKDLNENEVLWVKDHPNAISIRNLVDVMKVVFNKDILFIKRKVPSSQILEYSDLTCSIAGTIALESISVGVPSIVFSEIFYNKSNFIKSVIDLNDFSFTKYTLLYETKDVNDDINISEIGVVGFIHDPEIFPFVLEEVNLIAIGSLIDIL